MRPAQREVAAVIRRSGVHSLLLALGNQHYTGTDAEFAELARDIHKALHDNRID